MTGGMSGLLKYPSPQTTRQKNLAKISENFSTIEHFVLYNGSNKLRMLDEMRGCDVMG